MTAENSQTVVAISAEARRRLEEAEETLRAIREGEVDALVVRNSMEEQVFTLQGGSESYRTFMETMHLGAAALDSDGGVLYANTHLCSLLETDLQDLQKRGLLSVFPIDASEILDRLLRTTTSGTATAEFKAYLLGEEKFFQASATPLKVGLVDGWAVTFADHTERVRTSAIKEAERTARAIISSANEAVVVCDLTGRITHVSAAASTVCAVEPIGRQFTDSIPLRFVETSGFSGTHDLLAAALAGKLVKGVEATTLATPQRCDLLVSAAQLKAGDDTVLGAVVTLVDISARKAAERQQLLLVDELDHRIKNTLAMVLAICSHTMKDSESLSSFHDAFVGRINALAATHDLLALNAWAMLSVKDLVTAELIPYLKADSERLRLKGPEVRLKSRAAIALGLIFHELVTNAVKHGALSNETGVIEIHVKTGSNPDDPLQIRWDEVGGPPVLEPTRIGFGRTVINRSLKYSAAGRAHLEFKPNGLVCEIDVPGEDVQTPSS